MVVFGSLVRAWLLCLAVQRGQIARSCLSPEPRVVLRVLVRSLRKLGVLSLECEAGMETGSDSHCWLSRCGRGTLRGWITAFGMTCHHFDLRQPLPLIGCLARPTNAHSVPANCMVRWNPPRHVNTR